MTTAQVTVHLKGKTECFECQPKAAPKSFPVRELQSSSNQVAKHVLLTTPEWCDLLNSCAAALMRKL
jgi:hypothetical protein